MNYQGLDVKIPVEDTDYDHLSKTALAEIDSMVQAAFDAGNNEIVLDTNIRGSFPLDNINKLAAPLIESWAANVFKDVLTILDNEYSLFHVEVGAKRTDLADVVLQFKVIHGQAQARTTANVDVKSTADTIMNSGKGPNITSFAKIRTAYIEDPDFIFIILSIKYHPYSQTNADGKARGIIDLKDFNSYDFKYLSETDFSINPALGTGQIQIKDIHYVGIEPRTTWELMQLLDEKYVRSSKHSFDGWKREAEKRGWIKSN